MQSISCRIEAVCVKQLQDGKPAFRTCAGIVAVMGAGSFAVYTIGFCLIRQSSTSPIVCFHQSTKFLGLHRRAKALGLVVPWINERRGGISRRFSCRCAARDFCEGFRNPRAATGVSNDGSDCGLHRCGEAVTGVSVLTS